MRKLLIMLMLVSGYCYAQEPSFNFETNKLYKINISGADNVTIADEIERLIEKNLLCIFSDVDQLTSTGYFIVDNFYKVHEIEKMINNRDGLAYLSYEELPLTEDIFLEIYMKRGGYKPVEFPSYSPKKVQMGPFQKLTDELYLKAKEVWDKKYSN